MSWHARSILLCGLVLGAVASSFACAEFETTYFQNRVNEATQEVVAHRYGAPHRIERMSGGQSVWTYFDRGSGTSGYSGYARSTYCRTYLLTFDEQGVLRNWRQEDCLEKRKQASEPTSDRQ